MRETVSEDQVASRLVAAALALLVATTGVAVALAVALPSAPASTFGGPGHGGKPSPDAPYAGPADARAVLAACPGPVEASIACYTSRLRPLLMARGSVAAFDVLEGMVALNPLIDAAAHPLGHVLGVYAFDAYGSAEETLRTCSYKVFQGCFHGALQAYFFSLPAVDERSVQVCPKAVEDSFRSYVCLHGLGHGLMMATAYDLNESLRLCGAIEAAAFEWSSCYGGVFMENFAGWRESQDGSASAVHQHLGGGHGSKMDRYWLDLRNLDYPCDMVPDETKWDCWHFHTSVISYFNHANFTDVIQRCGALEPHLSSACFRSMGRDLSAFAQRNASEGARVCGSAPSPGGGACVRGFLSDTILFFMDPDQGLPICRAMPDHLKEVCYEELGTQGLGIARERMRDVCARVEEGYAPTCLRAAGVA